ncbi:hypothetical protein FB451DRAFT_1176622 [Mycena latifolia]|nr:hypothetical protein FB451DRAFT_1176622 [Mycena latifolia]
MEMTETRKDLPGFPSLGFKSAAPLSLPYPHHLAFPPFFSSLFRPRPREGAGQRSRVLTFERPSIPPFLLPPSLLRRLPYVKTARKLRDRRQRVDVKDGSRAKSQDASSLRESTVLAPSRRRRVQYDQESRPSRRHQASRVKTFKTPQAFESQDIPSFQDAGELKLTKNSLQAINVKTLKRKTSVGYHARTKIRRKTSSRSRPQDYQDSPQALKTQVKDPQAQYLGGIPSKEQDFKSPSDQVIKLKILKIKAPFKTQVLKSPSSPQDSQDSLQIIKSQDIKFKTSVGYRSRSKTSNRRQVVKTLKTCIKSSSSRPRWDTVQEARRQVAFKISQDMFKSKPRGSRVSRPRWVTVRDSRRQVRLKSQDGVKFKTHKIKDKNTRFKSAQDSRPDGSLQDIKLRPAEVQDLQDTPQGFKFRTMKQNLGGQDLPQRPQLQDLQDLSGRLRKMRKTFKSTSQDAVKLLLKNQEARCSSVQHSKRLQVRQGIPTSSLQVQDAQDLARRLRQDIKALGMLR